MKELLLFSTRNVHFTFNDCVYLQSLNLKRLLPENITTKSAYTSTKLSSKFRRLENQHSIVYYAECPESSCSENYTAEAGRRLTEHAIDHNGRDSKWYIFQHAVEKDNSPPTIDEFEIIERSYKNVTFKRKITESLLIKISEQVSRNLCTSAFLIENILSLFNSCFKFCIFL